MKSRIRQALLIFLPLFTVLFFNSCKEKGCTDRSAINYNSVAEEDDGSCIYCNGVTDTLDTISVVLIDNNFSSPHYTDAVGTFYITHIRTTYSFPECGTKDCALLVSFESNVIEEMSFTFSLQGSGNVNFSWFKSIVVPSNANQELGAIPKNNIGNPCGSLSGTSVFVNVSGIITYN